MQQKGKSLAKHRWQLAYNWQPWIITVTWTDPRLWYNTHAEDPPLEDLCDMASVGPRPPSSGLQCQWKSTRPMILSWKFLKLWWAVARVASCCQQYQGQHTSPVILHQRRCLVTDNKWWRDTRPDFFWITSAEMWCEHLNNHVYIVRSLSWMLWPRTFFFHVKPRTRGQFSIM